MIKYQAECSGLKNEEESLNYGALHLFFFSQLFKKVGNVHVGMKRSIIPENATMKPTEDFFPPQCVRSHT